MFDDATVRAAAKVAARLNVEPAALLAVAEVESAGKAFARVNSKNEPLIRFEGHYFDRRLTAAQRKKARAEGLSSPTAGTVKNPAKQEDRWKLLNRAIAINSTAALESVSWGLGQVMGSHWKALGYGSVTEMVNECRSSVAGQIEVMARFIEKNDLAGHLRRKDWAKFARAYNGPGYKQNAYDTKMARAYAKWAKADAPKAPAESIPAPPAAPTRTDSTLRRGSYGPIVGDLQRNLNTLGYGPLKVDDRFGEDTERAVVAFQNDHGLLVDGIAGGRTNTAIGKAIKDRETKPKLDAAAAVVDDAAGKGVSKTEVITTVTGIGGVATVVKETADSVRDGATSLMSLGPWILLAFVIAAGAGYVIWDRRRKRLAAKAVQEVL